MTAVQVEHSGLSHLLAAECQQLAREQGGPLGGLLHLDDMRMARMRPAASSSMHISL